MSVDFGGSAKRTGSCPPSMPWRATAGFRSRARRLLRGRANASRGRTSSCLPACSTLFSGSTRSVPVECLKQAARRDHPHDLERRADREPPHPRLHDRGLPQVPWIDHDGIEHNPTIRVISTEPSENDWLAVNQVTVRTLDFERRFDVVLYCNGMPVSIIELKKAGSENADVAAAHAQLATYLREFPMAFRFACSPWPATGSRRATARRSPRSTTSRRGTSTTTACPSSTGADDRDGHRHRARPAHRRRLQPGAVPPAAAQLRRLRPECRRAGEADRQAAPVLRRHQGASAATIARGRVQRQGRRRLAHPGLGQVDGDGALHPPRAARTRR